MVVFKREQIEKHQTKLYLTTDARDRLRAVSKASGLTMSVIVEVLIRDYCHSEDDSRKAARRHLAGEQE